MISIVQTIFEEFELPSPEEQDQITNQFMKDLFNSLKKHAEEKGEQFPKFKIPPSRPDSILDAKKRPIEI